MSPISPINAFTVDVEDYFHVSGFADRIRPEDWGGFESRVERSTERLLELLAAKGVRGTFFVLGWVAERSPKLVRSIAAAGHAVACHGYGHQLLYDIGPEAFRADLRRSRYVLEELAASSVTAYRAPSFSITRRSTWALEVLAEEGFRDDASIFPTYHDRYGLPGTPVGPYVVETPSGPIREFPTTVRQVGGVRLPVSGGGYFRLLPDWFTTGCLRSVNDREGRPFVFYVHPWEIDPEQPIVPGRRLARWRHRVNLARTLPRLEALLDRFSFGPLHEALDGLGELPRLSLGDLVPGTRGRVAGEERLREVMR